MGKWSNIGKDYWDIVWLVKFQKEVCLCGLENVQNMYLSKQKEAHKLI
jgi:hypothetical protein